MSNQPTQKEIPQCNIDTAKDAFARDRPLTEDLRPGTFFDDPDYLDALSHNAKALVCAIQCTGDHPDRPALCHIQSEVAHDAYHKTQNQEFLAMSFALEAMSLRYTPAAHPGRGKSNHHMGRLCQTKWEKQRNIADLDEAARHYKLAVEFAVEDDAVLCEWVCDAAVVHLQRYERTNQNDDKEEACRYFDRAIELVGQSSTRPRHLSNKGEFLYRTVSGNDLERNVRLSASIECHDEAIEFCDSQWDLASEPQSLYGMIHRNAARAYIARFSITKQIEDQKKAFSLFEEALTYETPGSNDWNLFTNELANAYILNAKVLGYPEQEEKACELWHKAIETSPNAISARTNLAEFYRQKAEISFDRRVTQNLLQRAVVLAEDAVKLLPPGYSEPGVAYSCCASIYCTMYEGSGELSCIDKAVEYGRQAAQSQNTWDCYRLLGQLLAVRYEQHQRPEDMQECVAAAMQAFSKCPPGDSDSQSHCLWIMGKASRAMYDNFRMAEILHKAIMAFSKASQLMHNDPSSRALVLNDLGNAYTQLFSHEALPEHLEKGIEVYKEALLELQRAHDTDQHPDILMVNSDLGYVMVQRFLHWRADADIDAAIKYYRRSLLNIDEHHPRHAIRVGNLSYALQLHFQNKENLDDLRETQRLLAGTLEGPVPLSDRLKTMLVMLVGSAYQAFYQTTGQLADLENAIEYYNKAIAVEGTASSSFRGVAMHNKAKTLELIAESTGKLSDFEASEKVFEEAQRMLSEGDPMYWGPVVEQADLLYTMYDRKLGPDFKRHGCRALEKYEYIAKLKALAPGISITVASRAAQLYNDILQDREKARDYILISLDLLPEAILMHASRLEQLKFIRRYQYVPSSVSSLSIGAGDPANTVIHRLEAGRAFIWDRIQGRASQLDEIEAANPELSQKFRTLQQRIAQVAKSSGSLGTIDLASVTPDDASRMQRQNDSDAYRQVLGEIRALPGFNSFLRTPNTTADLQAYAIDAPIVFINCSGYRSDALIITKYNVSHLSLPSFSLDQVELWAMRFMEARVGLSMGESEEWSLNEYKVVMKWLWEAAAKPVMSTIDWDKYERGPFGKPRITWVSTGWISVLPIHAAGDFFVASTEEDKPRCVHDMVVSSYTTSLKSLDFTRQNAHRMKKEMQPGPNPQALVAAMATTPGLGPDGDLNVEPEINAIEKILSPFFDIKVLKQPDPRSVETHLASSTIAHFACHALADTKDPSQSAIMLQDNQAKSSPFSTRRILNLNLKTCQLVYLSACESGANKDIMLRDEGIHIAGGFHIAGVPHVLSTLWTVEDSVSAELAGLFYANLIEAGRDDVDLARVPHAFHQAIGEMRRRRVHPMLWGPFIHSGP